jgi:WD40 repeat protein
LWDTTTGEKLRTAQGCFSSVAFSPDGKALAVGTWAAGGHGGAALWDAATLTERHRLPEVAEAYWVAFSGNGQYVAVAGSTDTKARIDEAATGKLLRTFPCGQTNVVRVALQANGQVLVTGCDNGKVTLWETATGQEIRALRGAEGLLAMTPDGHLLATCSGDGTVRLWDAATGNELFPRTGPQEMGAMAVSPDGATLATGGATRRLWDARTAKVRQALILHRGSVGGVVFSPDGRTLASSGGGTVRLWDAATGDERRSFADLTGGLGQVAFSRDGRLLAVVRKDGPANATVWDLATGQLRSTLQGRDDPGTRGFLRQVAFNSTAALLATCSGPEIRLWDTATGRQVAELTVPNNEVNDLAFSPDGRRLAACYFEDLLKVWDVATRNEIRTLRGHGENLSGVAWSPDGKQLASAGADGTVRLWDGETGAAGKVFRLHRPSGHLGGLTFSPEGRHLLVNSGQGTVFVLRLGLPAPAP